jgi:hypothetical protein
MTHGYIIINPNNEKEAEYFVLATNKGLKNNTPHPDWLHVLCVIRDPGDPPHEKLIEYYKAYNRGGLALLPNTLRQVWNEYFERGKYIKDFNIVIKKKINKNREFQKIGQTFDKYADDPNWNVAILCKKCNRYVRRGIYDKKHGEECTVTRATDKLRDTLIAHFKGQLIH